MTPEEEIRAAFANEWAKWLDQEIMREVAEGNAVDFDGHPIARGDYVKTLCGDLGKPVLGRVVGMEHDLKAGCTTYRVVVGVRDVGSVRMPIVVKRWQSAVEYIGADRVFAARDAFKVWIP